jgi:hypothetical protein
VSLDGRGLDGTTVIGDEYSLLHPNLTSLRKANRICLAPSHSFRPTPHSWSSLSLLFDYVLLCYLVRWYFLLNPRFFSHFRYRDWPGSRGVDDDKTTTMHIERKTKTTMVACSARFRREEGRASPSTAGEMCRGKRAYAAESP